MLKICESLFEYLNSNNIKYCHWKSNFSLEKSLSGKTDLDILIDREDQSKVETAIKKYDLKKIISPPEKQYPGMEDYLGFDYETGTLIHLHVHYQLILGQKYIKNHLLPIEKIVFGNLVKKFNVYIPCPEMELLLLIIRAHVKVDVVSLIKHAIKDLGSSSYTSFPTAIEKEFSYLIENCNIEKLKHLLVLTGLPLSEEIFLGFIRKFSENRLKSYDVLKTEVKILSSLKRYRRNRSILVYIKYFYLFIRDSPIAYWMVRPRKKTLCHFGKIISIVGADGSGKSTLSKDLNDWLSWKLTVKKYYYGIPKNFFCQSMDYTIRGLNKFRLKYFAFLLQSYYWIYTAKTRHTISERSSKDIEKGGVVITDRFPFKGFYDMKEPMDGPRLRKCTTKIGGYFSKVESNYYNKIKYPDYIFVLQVNIDELRRRKTDLDILTHRIKAAAVNTFKSSEGVILINANRPYFDVQLELKRKIWEFL